MSNRVPSEINITHIVLSDFQILQSQNKSHIRNKKTFTARLTLKQQQQITVIPTSASTLCIQYNEGTTQPFEGKPKAGRVG